MRTPAFPVLFVSPHAKPGGAETYLELLTDELGDEWIAGIVALEDGPLVERLRRRGRDVLVIPTGPAARDMAHAALALRREVLRARPAAIHANGVKAALVAAAARAGLPPPVVWVKHDHSFDGSLSTVAALGARFVVGVSGSVVAALPGVLRRKVRIVPNGIRRPAIAPDAGRARLRALMGVPEDAPVVGLVGRLHPVKGHDDLIRAAPDVLAAAPDTRFAFLGSPDERFSDHRLALERTAVALGVAASISWLGYHEAPFELMSGFDVAVMPSKALRGRPSEGFPMSAAELLALGVPVVAYRRGGTPEALGGCGLLVPADDPRALAREVVRVLTDASLRARMRDRGLERARELDVGSLGDRMRSLYREAVRRGDERRIPSTRREAVP
jgi:glycosyltransferase involved in cell wall biosynthesis